MPIILTTKAAEFKRIVVGSQPRQIAELNLISKNNFAKTGWWSGSRCRP
jgi:hypothetical protein